MAKQREMPHLARRHVEEMLQLLEGWERRVDQSESHAQHAQMILNALMKELIEDHALVERALRACWI